MYLCAIVITDQGNLPWSFREGLSMTALTTFLPAEREDFFTANRNVFSGSTENANNFATNDPDKFDWNKLIVDNRTDSNIFFNVEIKPLSELMAGSGIAAPDHQVVVDMDNKTVIHTPKNQYKLTKHVDAYNAVNEAINELADKGLINIDGAVIKDSCLYKGGRTIREYFFPSEIIKIKGDNIAMRLVVINSYDGSTNFSVQCGGFRLVCCNGIVSGDRIVSLNAQHSSGFSLDSIRPKLLSAINQYKKAGDYWDKLYQTKLSDLQAERILMEFSTNSNKLSIAKLNGFTQLWKQHKKDIGANYWAMLQVLTYWATHQEVSKRSQQNAPFMVYQRQNQINSFMQTKAWDVA